MFNLMDMEEESGQETRIKAAEFLVHSLKPHGISSADAASLGRPYAVLRFCYLSPITTTNSQ